MSETEATELGDLLRLLAALGLPTTSEGHYPGETCESFRLRKLGVLQIYSRGWDKARLESLSPEHLDTAARAIIEQSTRTLRDWRACIARLYRAGHDLLLIAELTRVPLETLHAWYPYAPESPK